MTLIYSAEEEALMVARARLGDEAAWDQLVKNHQEAVFRLAYLFVENADDAEDVAQGVFIRAYLKLDQYDDGRPLRPWLLGITANLGRNKRRSAGRYWRALQRLVQQRSIETAMPPPGIRTDANVLWQAVQQLPTSQREVIYLRYFLQLSEAETAASLGIAAGTVKSRTHRGLKRLRLIIEREYPELTDDPTF
jgi:RNA polymerase sigma-70 factor (ECF subfamily)